MQDTAQTSEQTYEAVRAHAREASLLVSAQSVLAWDERTKLPPAGGAYRAEQIAHLAGLIHQRQTEPQMGAWLDELMGSPLAADPHSDTGTVIHRLKRDYDKKTRLPKSLVEQLAHTSVVGQRTWASARQANDFGQFQPVLEKTLTLKRQEAEALGYTDSLYDPLLDDYEPGETTNVVTRVLADLRDELVPLVTEIQESLHAADVSIFQRSYPVAAQQKFGCLAATAIGFDFTAGRLDETDHPFCTELGPHDIRITTRYDEHAFAGGFFSILHEAGHGIYEQGLPHDQFGLPTGAYVSLGIHESQSRLWENLVGRSRGFWEHFYPQSQEMFQSALAEVPLDAFYFAINDVRPSLIRTESDEVTYNLHIMIRFELEQALLAGELSVADLQHEWNARYQSYLGVEPPDAAQGVLQDVHWSAGLFGYFPTYTLGNLYAAQFFRQANEELGDLSDQFRRGEFSQLRGWLADKIYRHGRRYSPGELVERITGGPLAHDALVEQLRGKLGPLYGFA